MVPFYRCPKNKCKYCGRIGHVRKDCPKLKLKHKINKDYTTETMEQDTDLDVSYGAHCEICKNSARNNNETSVLQTN